MEAKRKLFCVAHHLGKDSTETFSTALEGVDVVFHLAEVKHNSLSEPVGELFGTSIKGTYGLLTASSIALVRKMLYICTLYA